VEPYTEGTVVGLIRSSESAYLCKILRASLGVPPLRGGAHFPGVIAKQNITASRKSLLLGSGEQPG